MMSNGYFVQGERRAERVRDLFSAIAWRYDLMNDLQSLGFHRVWKRRLVRWAKVGPGERCLDVCCGTGDLTAGLVGNGGRTVGLDFSGAMLRRAKRRVPSAGWVCGDALALPFAAGVFDVATVGYGLRNLARLRDGLVELRRVLKPGGRLLILDFGKPARRTWRRVYFAYLKRVVPVLGKLVCGDGAAYRYILESLLEYPAQAELEALLEELGAKVELKNFLGGVMSIHRAEFGRAGGGAVGC